MYRYVVQGLSGVVARGGLWQSDEKAPCKEAVGRLRRGQFPAQPVQTLFTRGFNIYAGSRHSCVQE